MTLSRARSILTGLHFTKESLSKREQEILAIAEGLLRLIDEVDALSPDEQKIRALSMAPGVMEVVVCRDGVEVHPEDEPDPIRFVSGDFTVEQVRTAVGAGIPVRSEP